MNARQPNPHVTVSKLGKTCCTQAAPANAHSLASAWICTISSPLKIHPLQTHNIIRKSSYMYYYGMSFHVQFCIVSFTNLTKDCGQIVWTL